MTYFKKDGFVHNLTTEAKALSFKVETSVTAETIEDIIVTALECQSNCWAGLDNTTDEWANCPEDLPVAQYATQLILDGREVALYDIEDEDEMWTLTLPKLLTGIGLALGRGYDLTDYADEVLQLSLFGELVYG